MKVYFKQPSLSDDTTYTYTNGGIIWLCGHELKYRKVSKQRFRDKVESGVWVIVR